MRRIEAAWLHAAGAVALEPDEAFDSSQYDGPPDDQRRIDYLPTPAEIHNACASIRKGWTMSEKRRRFVGDYVPDEEERLWQPPIIDTSHVRISSARVGADAAR